MIKIFIMFVVLQRLLLWMISVGCCSADGTACDNVSGREKVDGTACDNVSGRERVAKKDYLRYRYHKCAPGEDLIDDARHSAESALNNVMREVYCWAKLANAVDKSMVRVENLPKALYFRLQHVLRRYNTKRVMNNQNKIPKDLYKTVQEVVDVVIRAVLMKDRCPQVDKNKVKGESVEVLVDCSMIRR